MVERIYYYKCTNSNCSNEEFLDKYDDIVLCPICKALMDGPIILAVGESDPWEDPLDGDIEPYDDNKDYHIDETWKEY